MAKYLTDADLLREIKRSQVNRDANPDAPPGSWITPELANMYVLLATKYAKSGSWRGYSYREDMISHALVHLVKSGLKFDPERGSGPFAYLTTFVYRSFIDFHSKETKQRDIRDEVLVTSGLLPSWKRQEQEREDKDNHNHTGIKKGK